MKGDIFNVYISILQQTRPLQAKNKLIVSEAKLKEIQQGPVNLLKNQIGPIVKAIQKQMKFKNGKTRQGCFSLLTQLVNVLPGALNNHLPQVVPGIQFSINDKTSTSNMKIDTLSFLNHLLLTHDEKLFHPYLEALVQVCFLLLFNLP